ncbi:MAG: hypothetical protein KGL53_13105, partial [Elusimicrobia bacterium]|nr:hypothetical protein [Elusimicrobiota bacterium]
AAACAAIRATPGAALVKLADRIANVEASLEDSPEKLAKYKREHAGFREAMRGEEKGGRMLAYLDSLVAADAPPWLARRRFDCAACGERAATLTLWGERPPGAAGLEGASVGFEGFVSNGAVSVKDPGAVKEALAAGDLPKLRFLVGDPTDFWCIDCGACYCCEHWRPHEPVFDGGFYDMTYGTCPKGHRHEIDD